MSRCDVGVKLIFFYDMRLNHRNPHNDQSLLNKRLELYIGSGTKKKKKKFMDFLKFNILSALETFILSFSTLQ